MNSPETLFPTEIQADSDHRPMAIDRVALRSIRHPIVPAHAVESQDPDCIHNHSAIAPTRRATRV